MAGACNGLNEAVWWCGLQSKEALACLTPGCEGVLTRAVVLGAEAGAYKELYSRLLRGKPRAQPPPNETAAVAVPTRRAQGTLDASEALFTGVLKKDALLSCRVLTHDGLLRTNVKSAIIIIFG